MLYLFIGYLFIFFNFNIGGFDLFSNGIGCVLIYAGTRQYAEEVPSFKESEYWICGLIIAHYAFRILSRSLDGALYPIISILDLFETGGIMYLVYLTVRGIGELEKSRSLWLNSGKLMKIWKCQAVCSIGAIQLTWIPIDGLRALSLLFGLLGIVANIFFLVELYSVKQKLEVIQ